MCNFKSPWFGFFLTSTVLSPAFWFDLHVASLYHRCRYYPCPTTPMRVFILSLVLYLGRKSPMIEQTAPKRKVNASLYWDLRWLVVCLSPDEPHVAFRFWTAFDSLCLVFILYVRRQECRAYPFMFCDLEFVFALYGFLSCKLHWDNWTIMH